MLINANKKALAEVYEILNLLPQEEYQKIPPNLIEYIKMNMDEEVEVDIESVENGHMLQETNNILATIYMKYLSTSQEKIVIKNLMELEKSNNAKKQNIKCDDSMFSRKKMVETDESDRNILVLKHQTFFSRVLDKLKQFVERIKLWKR